ncbi:MAG: hypothetical protein IPG96_09635 [Proteobacteria bacterium]|nr:hypothetical protein [Pseudomonadota bacterium]
MGGAFAGPVDGGGEVIALHYAGMIADLRPVAAKRLWTELVQRAQPFWGGRIALSPLNNVESLRVAKASGQVTVNHLKGSWNLVLQAEGWALIDGDLRDEVFAATQRNAFLKRGFDRLSAGYTLQLGSEGGTISFPATPPPRAHLTGPRPPRMTLRFLDPSYTRSQQDLAAAYHRGVAGEELSALELAEALNAETRPLRRYHFEASGDVDQLEAIRRFVHWMDYVPPGGKHVPALVPTGGGLAWKVVRGFVVDAKPFDASDPFRIRPVELRGVWLNDPRLSGLGYNVFQTAAFFRDEYRPVAGVHWSVNEPPIGGPVSAATRFSQRWQRDQLRIARPEPREGLALLAQAAEDEPMDAAQGWVERIAARLQRQSGLLAPRWRQDPTEERPERVVLATLRASLPAALRGDEAFIKRFDCAERLSRFAVTDLDRVRSYVLVALGPRQRPGAAPRAELVIELDGQTGALTQATWSDSEVTYPGLSEAEAVSRARRALLEDERSGLRGVFASWRLRWATAKVARVWAARHGPSRFHPSYRVDLAGATVLVYADGRSEVLR